MTQSLPNAPLRAAGQLLFAVVGAAAGLLCLALLMDVSLHDVTAQHVLFNVWNTGANRLLDGLPEVLSAVLGISLTVVAIVVQLAAQRYPAKIVDVFMYDRLNIATFAFMASSCVYVVLASATNVGNNLPWVAMFALVLTVANFALLLPYFAHVFAFLEPTNLISEIKEQAWNRMERLPSHPTDVAQAQAVAASALDRVADNCMAALAQSDRNLAVHSLETLQALISDYCALKSQLPDAWNHIDATYFGTLASESVEDLIEQKTWFEAKGLMEFERMIRRALDEMSEVVSQIARSTRAITMAAANQGQWATVLLCLRVFNTYIRHGLNRRNVRAVYNILYEYRLLATALLQTRPDLSLKVVEYLIYYGRTANESGLPFVTVTVAHDVRVICEAAFDIAGAEMETMVDLFLRLDQPVDGKGDEVALMGVRKAQSILGGFMVRRQAHEVVDRIRADMRGERADRLRFIRDEILSVTERKFWEITDRGFNFDYTPPEDHPSIVTFFEPMLG